MPPVIEFRLLLELFPCARAAVELLLILSVELPNAEALPVPSIVKLPVVTAEATTVDELAWTLSTAPEAYWVAVPVRVRLFAERLAED